MFDSFFEKLKNGLSKTKNSFTEKISEVLNFASAIDDELYEEIEEILITADIGMETTIYIMDKLKEKVKQNKIKEPSEIKDCLKQVILEMLDYEKGTITPDSTPCIMLIVGVNGVGKTTSIGKVSYKLKGNGYKVILGAADTFRAAAIEQLEIWSNRAGVDIIKHKEGADPAAVVFDSICAAKARKCDILICDTAGRLHNKKNLMDELGKINRVIDKEYPEAKKEILLVLDATTGQNAVIQAKQFTEVCPVDGLILTKLDGSAKGGIIISIKHQLNIPVKLIGVGEGIDDLQEFNSEDFVNALF